MSRRTYRGLPINTYSQSQGEALNEGGSSIFEAKGELFDDWVGEDFAGDALDLGDCSVVGEAILEGQEEVFALADICDAAIVHPAERVGYCLALGIEHGSFESDIDMSLHRV